MLARSKEQRMNKAPFILHFCRSDACRVLTGSCVDPPDIRAAEYACQMGTLWKAAGSVSDQIRADNVE